jgi:predicted RNA-binding Zn-ribbon protein involved in translation (DUF1610 family)
MKNQYKGKYTKCRTCKHIEEVMNFLVVVKQSCPYKVPNVGNSTKSRCQQCDKWEVKE